MSHGGEHLTTLAYQIGRNKYIVSTEMRQECVLVGSKGKMKTYVIKV